MGEFVTHSILTSEKWGASAKLHFFYWLAWDNKILTLTNLVKKVVIFVLRILVRCVTKTRRRWSISCFNAITPTASSIFQADFRFTFFDKECSQDLVFLDPLSSRSAPSSLGPHFLGYLLEHLDGKK